MATPEIPVEDIGTDRPETKRWTVNKKMDIVLRHMHGCSIDTLSRELGIPSSQIEERYRWAIDGMAGALKSRNSAPLQAELDLAKKQIGELSMENEHLRARSQRNGVFLGGRWKR